MKKLVVLGAGALAAGSIGLLGAGLAHSEPLNPNSVNMIGQPYYKAVKALHAMGLSTSFGGSVGSDLPQQQCMVASQKVVGQGRMSLNLDCTKAAAQQMAEQGSAVTGGAPGMPNDGTLRPPQIPIAAAPAPAAPPPG